MIEFYVFPIPKKQQKTPEKMETYFDWISSVRTINFTELVQNSDVCSFHNV